MPAFSNALCSTCVSLKNAGIIDEVVDDFQPKCFLAPYYGGKEMPVALGNIFKQSVTKEKPGMRFHCPHVSINTGLTIALTDPDAPSRKDPKWSEMCHWIARIIVYGDGSDASSIEVSVEDELVECTFSIPSFCLCFLNLCRQTTWSS